MKDNLPWLDWVRFLAALAVVAGHARQTLFVDFSPLDSQSQNVLIAIFFSITRLGHEAVLVFFVLSGYLVGGRAFERARAGQFHLRNYMIDRVTRIFVPLIPAIVLTYVIQLAIDGRGEAMWIAVGNLFSLQGIFVPVMKYNGPLWSLSYEAWFYVLCGTTLYALFVGRSSVAFLCATASLMVFAVLHAYLLFCWLAGALVYVCKLKGRAVPVLVIGLGLSFLGLLLLQFGSGGAMQIAWDIRPFTGVVTLLFASGVALLVTQMVQFRTPERGVAGWLYRQGAVLAAFSYTLYLVHYPIIHLISNGWGGRI